MRPRWQLALLAVAVGLAVLLGFDLALRALGALPPDDPLLFFARTREPRVDPYVEVAPGHVAIRPDWVNDGEGLRGRRGRRAGRQFLLPGFRPAELAREKPEGTLRIVALGGSTTYGLFVGADAAFMARLGAALAARTGRPVEALNLGCAGFASDRVAALLPTALGLSPDLVVVYVGHNEMLGGALGPTAGLTPALRLRLALLTRSSIFAWLDHLTLRALRAAESERVREEVAALEAGQIPTFVPEAVPVSQRVAPSDAFRAQAAARYRANLARMIETARAAGVPLLFALPVANLRSRPGLSFHAEGFAAERAFDTALRAAAALRESGKHADALAALDRAIALSPGHALAHFLRGDALRALGRDDEARSAYRRAIDQDGVTHRITAPLEQAFLEIVREQGAPWADLRPVFHTDLSDAGAARLFVDHLHPTSAGHAAIAEALAPEAQALLAARLARWNAGRAAPRCAPFGLARRRPARDQAELLAELLRRDQAAVPGLGGAVGEEPGDHGGGDFRGCTAEALGESVAQCALLHQLGEHEARLHVEAAHATAVVLDRQHAGEPHEGRLRRGVGEAPTALTGRCRRIHGTGSRDEVDDGSVPTDEHARQHALHELELRHDVALEDACERVEGDLEDARQHARDLHDGVVDERVDRSELALRGRDRRVDRGGLEQVEAQWQDARAALANSGSGGFEAAGKRCAAGGVAVLVKLALSQRARRDGEVEALLRQGLRRGRPDAAARARDEGHPSRHVAQG